MTGKLFFATGLGVGYVLGARAGRERYEQIVARAQDLWRDPRVQATAHEAQRLTQEKAHDAGDALKETARSATGTAKEAAVHAQQAVKERVSGSHDESADPQPGAQDGGYATTGASTPRHLP